MSDLDHQIQSKEASGETLEQTRHNYSVQARMAESDDPTYGGINIDRSGRQSSAIASKQKESRSVSDMLMINAISDLADLENMMTRKYGEDFDLHLAAEFLDGETYKQLASIKDIDQRREAVAQAIKEGLEDGSIDPAKLEAMNPEFAQWVDKRVEDHAQREMALDQKAEASVNLQQDQRLEQSAMDAFGPASPSV